MTVSRIKGEGRAGGKIVIIVVIARKNDEAICPDLIFTLLYTDK
jgi:hypothetical protein